MSPTRETPGPAYSSKKNSSAYAHILIVFGGTYFDQRKKYPAAKQQKFLNFIHRSDFVPASSILPKLPFQKTS